MTASTLETRVGQLRGDAHDDWVDIEGQTELPLEVMEISPLSGEFERDDTSTHTRHWVYWELARRSALKRDVEKHHSRADDWHSLTEQPAEHAVTTLKQSRAILGERITAYLCGLRSDVQLDEWDAGIGQPSQATLERLRLAVAVVSIIEEWDGRDVARSWMAGRNRLLGTSPLQLLRESDPSEAGAAVMAAARGFIAGA